MEQALHLHIVKWLREQIFGGKYSPGSRRLSYRPIKLPKDEHQLF